MKKLSFLVATRVILILMVLMIPSWLCAGEVVLVANNSVPENDLSKDEIKAIFLGNKTKWSDNSRIIFIINTAAETRTFLSDYVGKTPFQFDNYWKYQAFTGKGMLPRSFDDEKELIQYVANTLGAIAYVSKNAPMAGVKMINVK